MIDGQDVPRVLVVCDEPINRVGGGGVTMRNLFLGWPKDGLAQLWAHHRFELDTSVCEQSLKLGSHTMPGNTWIPQSLRRQRGLVRRLRAVVRPGVRLDYAPVLDWASKYAPDIIYSQATPYPMYSWWLPRRLSHDLDVPLVNHIMDDWPTAAASDWMWPFKPFLQMRLKQQLIQLFGAAAANLAISREMAVEFEQRYGHRFTAFHNVVDLEEWTNPKTDYSSANNPFEVVYLGGIAEDMQLFSLLDVASSISAMQRSGMAIRMTVYGAEIYRDLFDQYFSGMLAVSHGGSVSRENLCATLAAADLLLIPANFDRRSLAMNRYSMPTKVPEYMASGTPILVYAPSFVPPARYATEEGWGYVVGERDKRALFDALGELSRSSALRARLGTRARQLAVENHDGARVRPRFRELLAKSASSASPSPKSSVKLSI